MAAPIILITGPQGSGKGTQAELLAKRLGGVTFSSGELWRSSQDPELVDVQASGGYAKSEVIIKLVEGFLQAVPQDKPIISDAFPRLLPEAEWLAGEAQRMGREIKLAILLDVPREESVKRLLARALIESRTDDTEAAIHGRLDLYDSQTSKVIELWRSLGILRPVNGVGTVEEVAERVNQVTDEAQI